MIEVHKILGPGLLESIYEECLCHELSLRKLSFERQKSIPVRYKDCKLDAFYRMDITVENVLLIEVKSVRAIEPVHEAQLLTYLKLSGIRLGILINFNTSCLRNGITRMVNHF